MNSSPNPERVSGHTELPWSFVQDLTVGHYSINAHMGPLVVRPATVYSLHDAVLIVRAVNSHDDLVAALRSLIDAIDTELWDSLQKFAPGCLIADGRLATARAALAKAFQS